MSATAREPIAPVWLERQINAERDLARAKLGVARSFPAGHQAQGHVATALSLAFGDDRPSWATLEAQAEEMRRAIRDGVRRWPPTTERLNTYGSWRNDPGVNLLNLRDFLSLPCSISYVKRQVAQWTAFRESQTGKKPDGEEMGQFESQSCHTLFHTTLWQHFGRMVYVLDEATYHLLASTALPALPARVLSAPLPAFVLRLPPSAFSFGVVGDPTGQRCDSISVALDCPSPDHEGQRDLAMLVSGRSPQGRHEDSNIAYVNAGMASDARLSDVRLLGSKYAADERIAGTDHLAITVPRVVLGFLLYMASEHPSLEPVPPVKRRTFGHIQSPKQRAAAEAHETERLAKAGRLGYVYVGGREGDRARAQGLGSAASGWTLHHQVWVRGHWRMVPYGPFSLERRPVRPKWIEPFLRGPDMAEALEQRAAKVQTAERVP